MKLAKLAAIAGAAMLAMQMPALAENYVVDAKGAHASINFKVKHLGYSWVTGRFDRFTGKFTFDETSPAKSKISIEIDTTSANTNHAARDKHLRSADFLHVDKFPNAKFESTVIEVTGKDTSIIKGKLTLLGVTKEIAIKAKYIGGGKDPWGGFRQGFEGTTSFAMADFGVKKSLGSASATVHLTLHVEDIRQ